MKKFLILPVLAFVFMAVPVHAATINLSPTTVTVTAGQTVEIVVAVDPARTPISAVKSVISYPADLLTATNFTYAPTWEPAFTQTQAGYDQMGGGTIIKTAGYPVYLENARTFGTITFTAVANGVATISVQDSSIAYDRNNKNELTGAGSSAVVTIQSATVTPGSTTSTKPAVTTIGTQSTQGTTATAPAAGQSGGAVGTNHGGNSGNGSALTATGSVALADASSTASSSDALSAAAQIAAAAGAGNGFFGSFWSWLILLLILILIAGGSWYYARKD